MGAVKGLPDARRLRTAAGAPVGGVREAAKAPSGPREGCGASVRRPGVRTGWSRPRWLLWARLGREGRRGAHEGRESRRRKGHAVRLP